MLPVPLLIFAAAFAVPLSSACGCFMVTAEPLHWACNKNGLEDIPTCVPLHTQVISIRTPSIWTYPSKIRRFTHLTRLNFNYVDYPIILRHTIHEKWNLTWFEIYRTKIQYVHPIWFLNNQNIRTLILNSNRIRHVSSDLFRYVPKLQTLYLCDNLLSSLPGNIFHGTSIKTLHFEKNDWHCDCELAVAMEYLWSRRVNDVLTGYCRYPEDVEGLDIRFLKRVDVCFQCRRGFCEGSTLI